MDKVDSYISTLTSGIGVGELIDNGSCGDHGGCVPIKVYPKIPSSDERNDDGGFRGKIPINKRRNYTCLFTKISIDGDPKVQVFRALAKELNKTDYREVIDGLSLFWIVNSDFFREGENYQEQNDYMENISNLVKDEFSGPEFNPDAVFPIIASAFNMSVEYDCCIEHKKCLPRLSGNPTGIRSIKFIQHTNTPDWVTFKSYYQKTRPQPSNDLKISAGADDRLSRSENEAILLSSGSLRLGHEGMRDYLARWDGEVSASPETLKYLGFRLCPTAPFGNCFYEASAGQTHGENAVSLRVLMHKAALRLIESPTRL